MLDRRSRAPTCCNTAFRRPVSESEATLLTPLRRSGLPQGRPLEARCDAHFIGTGALPEGSAWVKTSVAGRLQRLAKYTAMDRPVTGERMDASRYRFQVDWRAVVLLLAVGSFLALSVVVGKLADGAGASRLLFLCVSLIGAGGLLGAIARAQGAWSALDSRVLRYALVSGLLLAIPYALAFLAVRHVDASFITLSFVFPGLLTWLMAVPMGMERLRLGRLLGVFLGLASGALLVVGKWQQPDAIPLWIGAILAVPLFLALGNIYRTMAWPKGAAPVMLASLMLATGGLLLLPVVLVADLLRVGWTLDGGLILGLLAAQVATFTLLYYLFFILQRQAGPVYLSQIGPVAAVVGPTIGIFLLGEAPPANLLSAGLLMAVGLTIFHRGSLGK